MPRASRTRRSIRGPGWERTESRRAGESVSGCLGWLWVGPWIQEPQAPKNNPWGNLRNKAPPGGPADQGQWPIPEHSTHLLRCSKQFIVALLCLLRFDCWNNFRLNLYNQYLIFQRTFITNVFTIATAVHKPVICTYRVKILAPYNEFLIRKQTNKKKSRGYKPISHSI